MDWCEKYPAKPCDWSINHRINQWMARKSTWSTCNVSVLLFSCGDKISSQYLHHHCSPWTNHYIIIYIYVSIQCTVESSNNMALSEHNEHRITPESSSNHDFLATRYIPFPDTAILVVDQNPQAPRCFPGCSSQQDMTHPHGVWNLG